MDKNQGTSPTFHSQPASPSESRTTTDSEQIITGEQLSQQLQLKHTKSVHFLNTSTSTTTLPEKEPIKKLRPELNTLLTCMIKQTRTTIKSRHHIEILNTAIQNRDPPRGLRPRINPRIPDSKQIDFIIEWEEVTNTAALNYTKLLQKHWTHSEQIAQDNITNLNNRIELLNASLEEWNYIKETLDRIETQTKEDLARKNQRPPRMQLQSQQQIQPPQQQMIQPGPSQLTYSTEYSHEQLPQRNTGDLRRNQTRL